MLGNVWEWCWDWYSDYPPESPVDYPGPQEGPGRVSRGGSWAMEPQFARAAQRSLNGDVPSFRDPALGFRPVRTVP
jgi:sulfatase modifying factor 1